jgi:hypothetical protein
VSLLIFTHLIIRDSNDLSWSSSLMRYRYARTKIYVMADPSTKRFTDMNSTSLVRWMWPFQRLKQIFQQGSQLKDLFLL